MNQRSAIVLVVDGLSAGTLGAYGNSSVETPTFDALASRSIVAEHAMIDSGDPAKIYRSYLHGGHAAYVDHIYDAAPSLAERLVEQGRQTVWFSDQESLGQLSGSQSFVRRVALSTSLANRIDPVDSVEKSWLARFFAEAVHAIEDAREQSDLIWIHCPGACGPWDVPVDLRDAKRAPGDPEVYAQASPPSLKFDPEDADARFAIECAYQAQIELLDRVLEPFVEFIDSFLPESLLLVTGMRGYPLGQHAIAGIASSRAYAELLNVPFLARYPASSAVSDIHFRSQWTYQPADLAASLCDWFELSPTWRENVTIRRALADPDHPTRKLAVAKTPNEWVFRTPAWFARCYGNPQDDHNWCELYLMPDDRWHQNEISDRCPQVVHELAEFYRRCVESFPHGNLNEADIPERLLVPLE